MREIKRLNEELATLNRKIQLTIKPAGGHESGTDDGTEMKGQKATGESDDKPDLPRKARHVPPMEIAIPSNGLKKKYPKFAVKSRFSGNDKGMAGTRINPVCRPYFICNGKKGTPSFLFLKGKAFHLSVNNLPVNGILQIDYIHNRIMPGPVLLSSAKRSRPLKRCFSISAGSRFISSQTSSGSMEKFYTVILTDMLQHGQHVEGLLVTSHECGERAAFNL